VEIENSRSESKTERYTTTATRNGPSSTSSDGATHCGGWCAARPGQAKQSLGVCPDQVLSALPVSVLRREPRPRASVIPPAGFPGTAKRTDKKYTPALPTPNAPLSSWHPPRPPRLLPTPENKNKSRPSRCALHVARGKRTRCSLLSSWSKLSAR
jgi:hypothetical protein